MNMKRHTVLLIGIIVVIVIVVFLIARYVPFGERAKFVGTWYQPEDRFPFVAMTFYRDRSCSDFGWPGTWEIKDGELIITAMDGTSIARWSYSFSDNGRELTFSGMGTWIKWGD